MYTHFREWCLVIPCMRVHVCACVGTQSCQLFRILPIFYRYVLYGSTDLNGYLRNTGHPYTWVLYGLAALFQRSYRPYITVCSQ